MNTPEQDAPLSDEKLESVQGGFIISTLIATAAGYGAKKALEAAGVDVEGAVKEFFSPKSKDQPSPDKQRKDDWLMG